MSNVTHPLPEFEALQQQIHKKTDMLSEAFVRLETMKHYGTMKFPDLMEWEVYAERLLMELDDLVSYKKE